MEGRERLLRQLIGEVIVELAASEAEYRRDDSKVADDFRFMRVMLVDGLAAATKQSNEGDSNG